MTRPPRSSRAIRRGQPVHGVLMLRGYRRRSALNRVSDGSGDIAVPFLPGRLLLVVNDHQGEAAFPHREGYLKGRGREP